MLRSSGDSLSLFRRQWVKHLRCKKEHTAGCPAIALASFPTKQASNRHLYNPEFRRPWEEVDSHAPVGCPGQLQEAGLPRKPPATSEPRVSPWHGVNPETRTSFSRSRLKVTRPNAHAQPPGLRARPHSTSKQRLALVGCSRFFGNDPDAIVFRLTTLCLGNEYKHGKTGSGVL